MIFFLFFWGEGVKAAWEGVPRKVEAQKGKSIYSYLFWLCRTKRRCVFGFCFNISGGFQGMFNKIHRPRRNVVKCPISQVVTPTLFAQKTIRFQMEGPRTSTTEKRKTMSVTDKKQNWMVI